MDDEEDVAEDEEDEELDDEEELDEGAEPEEDEDAADEVGEEEASRRHAVKQRGARVLQRRAAEKRSPFEPVAYCYLSELFTSPRFALLPGGDRLALVHHVLDHYARHVGTGDGDLPDAEPPYLVRRLGARKHKGSQVWAARAKWPTRNAVLREAEAEIDPRGAPSRRGREAAPPVGLVGAGAAAAAAADRDRPRGRTSPASMLTPAMYSGDKIVPPRDPKPVRSKMHLRVSFQREASHHLRCVLGQYEGRDERVSRCFREVNLLALAAGTIADGAPTREQLDNDPKILYRSLRSVLQSTLLTKEMLANVDAWNEWARRVVHLLPGQPLGPEHDPACIDEIVRGNKSAALVAQKLWLLPAEPKRPFGRLERPPSSKRAALLRARRKRVRRRGKAIVPSARPGRPDRIRRDADAQSDDGSYMSDDDREQAESDVEPGSANNHKCQVMVLGATSV